MGNKSCQFQVKEGQNQSTGKYLLVLHQYLGVPIEVSDPQPLSVPLLQLQEQNKDGVGGYDSNRGGESCLLFRQEDFLACS